MFNRQKKTKKKYTNSKLHFIVFQTSKKPVNLSISKWFVYSSVCILFVAVLFVSIFSYRTYVVNADLNNNLSTLEQELQQLQVDKVKLGVENTNLKENLKDTLDDKTVKIADALYELENLQSSIKQIKEIVGLPVEDEGDTAPVPAIKTPVTSPPSRSGSRNVTSIRKYKDQSLNQVESEIDKNFESVEVLIQETKAELEELQANAEDRKQYLEDVPTLFPTTGKLTSTFGARWGSVHRGLDISNSAGTKIFAAGNGVVVESKYGYSYGNYILIQHKNGFETRYAHLSKRMAQVGEEIKQGDLIGLMGNTGTSYGTHLHYEIYYYNKLIDPLTIEDYLKYKE